MDFGSRIRELRKEKDISLRDFADLIKMDFTYLSKIENGKVEPPSEDKIRSMARELDADADIWGVVHAGYHQPCGVPVERRRYRTLSQQ